MGLTLLDTGVVIGFLDGDDAFHRAAHDAISEIARGDDFFAISAVSYAELLTGVGLGHHPREVVVGFMHDFAMRIIAVDEAVAARAAEIRAAHTAKGRGGRRRPTVRMPDALILASAAVSVDVDLLIVADRQWPKVDIGTEVRLLETT